jgi:hypothetical protein
MLLAKVDDLTGRMAELVAEVREVTEQLEPERAYSCRNAITMASVMIDEIRLRAHARPLDEPEPWDVCAPDRWGSDCERAVPWFPSAPGGPLRRAARRVVPPFGGPSRVAPWPKGRARFRYVAANARRPNFCAGLRHWRVAPWSRDGGD